MFRQKQVRGQNEPWPVSFLAKNTGSRFSGMAQCRKKSSHDCRSVRLTVRTVAATVTVTAAVTVSVTAAVTATAMDTQIYREKK